MVSTGARSLATRSLALCALLLYAHHDIGWEEGDCSDEGWKRKSIYEGAPNGPLGRTSDGSRGKRSVCALRGYRIWRCHLPHIAPQLVALGLLGINIFFKALATHLSMVLYREQLSTYRRGFKRGLLRASQKASPQCRPRMDARRQCEPGQSCSATSIRHPAYRMALSFHWL